jgi:hypothetical protein
MKLANPMKRRAVKGLKKIFLHSRFVNFLSYFCTRSEFFHI